jgi:hypothetical protein
MPHLPLILAINAALFIACGRLAKRWPVAIAGFVLLALGGYSSCWDRGTH